MGNAIKAQQASTKSAEYVMAKNKQQWLELFADDAVVQDPVGVSPLDPTGLGHKGKDAIEAFYDTIIAPGTITMDIQSSHPAGDECANVVKLTNAIGHGIVFKNLMAVVYCANDEGKIVSLKAYWDYNKLMEQTAKTMA